MPYIRKTYDEYQILQNFGYGDGWEEVSTEPTYKQANEAVKEYRQNQPEYPVKIKKVRIRKKELAQ